MTENDKIAIQLADEVKRRKKEIKSLDNPKYLTNCTFSWTDPLNPNKIINLHTCSDVRLLISMIAHIDTKYSTYNKAISLLELESDKDTSFLYLGFSYGAWIADIKTRIAKTQIAIKTSKLTALETKLNSIMSTDLKAQLALDEIKSELGI